jgi:hypothetical protein
MMGVFVGCKLAFYHADKKCNKLKIVFFIYFRPRTETAAVISNRAAKLARAETAAADCDSGTRLLS